MTKIKKIVAIALAFLMIFSSASVLANAWTVTVDDGFNLAIGTKFFINNGTEWVETVKAAPGDNVKARVYIDTDYYSNSSTLLFFYDKEFFTHSYEAGQNTLSVNPELEGYSGLLNPAPVLNSQVNAGYIDSAFLDKYAAISVNLFMPSGAKNAMYDGETWCFEIDLVVAGSGTGDLFVKDTTVQNSTSQNKALVNVPKGPEGGTSADVWPMWRWNANVTLTSQPISTKGSVTFNANDGAFANSESKEVINGDINDEIVVPAAPERAGYTFIGWVDAADTTPTYEEAQATVPVASIPYEPVAYNAYWIKNVNITFNTNGGSEIAARENVTPYTEFAAVEDPVRDGYTFKGWNPSIPETYPDVNAEYTAIWAKNVTVSFDTNGAEAIEAIPGVAGDEFTAVIEDPSKEGHWFVKWTPELPTVFPENDTTYKAIFETRAFPVTYYVDGAAIANIIVEYGEEIPTVIGTAVAPEGMSLSAWYTDEDMTQEFVAGTTMATSAVKLYAKYEYATYNAIFDACGGKFADGSATLSVPTIYMETINAPAEEPTKVGYEFAGWTPFPGTIMDEPNDMTFYATWNEVERNVEYYAEGYGLYETFDVKTGAELDVPAAPYLEGYDFIGWATEPNGEVVELPAVMPELEEGEVLKYYAIFEVERFSVTWRIDGKDTVEYLDFGTAIVAPEATKDNYTFIGWSTETDGEIVEIAATMPAEHLVYYAVFEINQYTITFDTDGGSEIEAITQDYATEIVAPADPTKTGYTFAGWEPALPETMPAGGLEVKAQWTINQYTITFNTDGGSEIEAITQDYATEIVAPANPTKTGYTFAGWEPALPETMPAEDVEIKATWTINQYTITFDVDGGSEVAPITQDYATEIVAPAAPTKTGYTFAGWEPALPETMPANDLTVKAQWTENDYTVTWVIDGEETAEAYTYGAAITAPEVAVEGYTFLGWALTEDGEIVDVAETMDAENLTYYAVLEINEYTVTWVIEGEETVETYAYGAAITAPEVAVEGKTLLGWALTEDGEIVDVAETMGTANLTYYAVLEINEYTVTWVIDGEETVEAYAYGAAITAPEVEVEGYTFLGWALTEDGEIVDVAETMGTANLTYYAVLEINSYEVTYVYAGEVPTGLTAPSATTAEFGATIVVPSVEVPAGYAVEWTMTGDVDGKMGTAPVTVTATWSKLSYTVTWSIDGVETSEELVYGAAITAPTAEKEGFEFKGWSLTDGGEIVEIAATMGTENLKYYAVFEEIVVETVKLKLVPVEGSTGVVERNGVIESYNDGYSVTDAEYDTPANYETYYVYGVTSRRIDEKGVRSHFTLNDPNAGYYTVETSTLPGKGVGTGSKIKVYSNDDPLNPVEEFYLIIFGDLNGDGRINTSDSAVLNKELAKPDWSNRRTLVPYRVKAADINLDTRINTSDSAELNSVLANSKTIDQITGKAS